jgi:hypothetical protein
VLPSSEVLKRFTAQKTFKLKTVALEASNMTAQEGSEIKIISLLINTGIINNGTVLTINITQLHKTCECENQ